MIQNRDMISISIQTWDYETGGDGKKLPWKYIYCIEKVMQGSDDMAQY